MILGILAALVLATSTPATQDADCLNCHADQELKSESGRNVHVAAEALKTGAHGNLHCQSCHTTIKDYPHPARPAKPQCTSCHAQTAGNVRGSAHAAQGPGSCAGCHGAGHDVKPARQVGLGQCESCHAREVGQYRASMHGVGRRTGVVDSPTCKSCHGSVHAVLLHTDPKSPVARENLPATCGACHANPDFVARHDIPFARPVEAYKLSVHGRAMARGNTSAPSCSDCHTAHSIYPGTDARSSLNHTKVPGTCGACHSEIGRVYAQSVHGVAARHGVPGSPVCTDCHGEHSILAPSEANSLVNPARVSTVTCGRCHSDERLAQRYNLPRDKVAAYQDSYHGLAKRSGSTVVANCASCHGVHNILPSSDPRSTIHASNLGRTCGTCHPGAGERFSIGQVHVTNTRGVHPVVSWVRFAYVLLLIPGTIGFMLLYVMLDFLAKLLRGGPHFSSGEKLVRMNLHFRIEHWLVMLSFPILIITGFALKFPESWWAAPMLQWENHFPFRGTIHRIAAAILTFSTVYHLVHLAVSRRDRIMLKQMMPTLKDATDMAGMIRYNLGLGGERPRFGMFSFAEKAEYLAFMWGTVVMLGSGLVLWFNNWALQALPKWVSDAATAIHFYEAVLASLAIAIWHMYMVIFDPEVYPMDKAWLTGNASADHLRHSRDRRYLRSLRAPKKREKGKE
ncbi:MAG: cytochrome b/b6 domain-containing protein [Candidatus Eisenbacteria bacterium]|nr:cytochrome b/b6 domain-containing protein [Candidatus Eisenbacteria bacterium]